MEAHTLNKASRICGEQALGLVARNVCTWVARDLASLLLFVDYCLPLCFTACVLPDGPTACGAATSWRVYRASHRFIFLRRGS
jgi:hypothetical protein